MSGAAADAEQHYGPDGAPPANDVGDGGRAPGLSSTAAVGSLRDLLESLRFDMDGQPQPPGAEGTDGGNIPGGVPDEYGAAAGTEAYNRVSSDGEGGPGINPRGGGRRSSADAYDYDDDEGQVFGDDDENNGAQGHRSRGSDDGAEYYRDQQGRGGGGSRRASRDANITDDEYRYGSGTGDDDDDGPYSDDDDDSVASAKSYEDAGYDNEEDYLFDQVSFVI